MKLNELFDIKAFADREERTAELAVRVVGLDISISLYGYVDDWKFPLELIPTLRGVFAQCLCLAVFVGRLRRVK